MPPHTIKMPIKSSNEYQALVKAGFILENQIMNASSDARVKHYLEYNFPILRRENFAFMVVPAGDETNFLTYASYSNKDLPSGDFFKGRKALIIRLIDYRYDLVAVMNREQQILELYLQHVFRGSRELIKPGLKTSLTASKRQTSCVTWKTNTKAGRSACSCTALRMKSFPYPTNSVPFVLCLRRRTSACTHAGTWLAAAATLPRSIRLAASA